MNVERLRELLADLPDHYEVCAGKAGNYAEIVELEGIRVPYRDQLGRSGTNSGVVVVIA